MARRKKLNMKMTQAEFNKLLDAKLEELYPELAAANRAATVYYGTYAERVNSKSTSTCPLCKRTLPILEFSTRNKHISGICWDCRYEAAINKIKFNPDKYKHSPLRSLVRVETEYLKDNSYIKLERCFCGEPATKFHHPNYNRPHEVTGYCKKHHDFIHTIITDLEVKFEFIPFHHKFRYYTLITNGDDTTYILKPEYFDEINNVERPLTYQQIKGLERKQYYIDLRVRRAEEDLLSAVKGHYGKKYTKQNVADYRAIFAPGGITI